jgi:hypothetical protein
MNKAFQLFRILAVCLVATLVCCVVVDAGAAPVQCKIVQASGGLRVRSEPDINSRVVYMLDDTEIVVVLLELEEWTLVAKNSGDRTPIGWACSEYLR